MVIIIDNYDSFVYNLAQYLGELGWEPVVYRNDKVTLAKIENMAPSHIIISPGPCTPLEAGISNGYQPLCYLTVRYNGKEVLILHPPHQDVIDKISTLYKGMVPSIFTLSLSIRTFSVSATNTNQVLSVRGASIKVAFIKAAIDKQASVTKALGHCLRRIDSQAEGLQSAVHVLEHLHLITQASGRLVVTRKTARTLEHETWKVVRHWSPY